MIRTHSGKAKRMEDVLHCKILHLIPTTGPQSKAHACAFFNYIRLVRRG